MRSRLILGLAVVAIAGVVTFVVWKFVRIETGDQGGTTGLAGTPYLAHVQDDRSGDRSGVVLHEKSKAYHGVTLYGCRGKPKEAYLLGMDGKILHEWRLELPYGEKLLWIQPDRDGNLVALGHGYVVKIGWSGKPIWEAPKARYHHGFTVDSNNRVLALSQLARRIPHGSGTIPIIDDQIVVLSPMGKQEAVISIYDLFGKWIPREHLEMIARGQKGEAPTKKRLEDELAIDSTHDVFHINSVEVIDRDLGYAKPGHLLICLRSLNLVAIVDPRNRRIVWKWRLGQRELDRPHAPVVTDSGNLMIFDNGWLRGHSRVIELDPGEQKVVWEYTAEPKKSFYTRRGGSAEPLPNGNLLITEQDQGHLFEITREGEIVWDYWNVKTGDGGKRRTIYRAMRLGPEALGKLKIPTDLADELRGRGYLP